ncbi:hypothetical protein KFL_003750080 [Klebsormidium nitens]|uniref:Transmembrane protein n=1 Tax=Klebsormidium nitens TaxID=105231 RepID=A0A1Y1IHZ0_KLENI|nr:hypothetical protein KFL_003750080 [Klebsormidium nitens]|eukprot:GAQ87758.1 hypothetical protein KFL_003750080 [Klebsormidium nitens]
MNGVNASGNRTGKIMVIMLVTGMLAAAASVHLGPALYGRPEEAQQRTYSSEGALKKRSMWSKGQNK